MRRNRAEIVHISRSSGSRRGNIEPGTAPNAEFAGVSEPSGSDGDLVVVIVVAVSLGIGELIEMGPSPSEQTPAQSRCCAEPFAQATLQAAGRMVDCTTQSHTIETVARPLLL